MVRIATRLSAVVITIVLQHFSFELRDVEEGGYLAVRAAVVDGVGGEAGAALGRAGGVGRAGVTLTRHLECEGL
jgi:hypothetical protein